MRGFVLSGVCLLVLSTGLSLFYGNDMVKAGEIFNALIGRGAVRTPVSLILFQVRLPRIAGGLLCGAALSISGLLLQTALDNVLASPGVIGINSGAGFFVLLAGIFFPFSAFGKQIFSFIGAVAAVVMVYGVCRLAGFSKATLILTGVAVSGLFTAGSNAIITLYPEAVADKTAFSLGGLSGVNWPEIAAAAPWIILGTAAAFLRSDSLELLLLGDETAAGLGIRPARLRGQALFLSAVLAGAAVSICGLLSFVGLIVPNLIRRAGIRNMAGEFLLCFLYGSSFLILCDILARNLFFPYELPVGLLLSFLGSPFFLYILIRRKRSVDL